MGNPKKCLIVLSSLYVLAFIVNLIPSIMFPDATIQPIHAVASGLLLVCMFGTCLLRNRVAKLLIMAILFASVTPLFGLNYFLNVNPEYVALLVFFIAILLLVIHELAVTRFDRIKP